ncbi:MAG: enolase C-terminal domain-like protein [Planctomycetaceae bacterium]
MPKPTDVKVLSAELTIQSFPFRSPLKFGGRIMDSTRIMNVQVTVENRGGKHATGFGSMPVGNVWAWPTDAVSSTDTLASMEDFAERVVRLTDGFDDYGHPIDIVYQISGEYEHLAKLVARDRQLSEPPPELAQLVAASPLDAALHDAYGRLLGLNSYHTLSSKFMAHDLAYYLDDQFEGEYLDRYVSPAPKPRMPLYHLVGALDPLTAADVVKPLADGLPESLQDWIKYNGLTHLKIKLNGDDLDWDVNRVLAIDRAAAETQQQLGRKDWYYSTDFNEKCRDVEYVLQFLQQIQQQSAAAYERIQYIEQPTHRTLTAHPDNKRHAAARLKPVVIDESLVDYESLLQARDLGYSGVALKACKGHTEAMLAAAAAQKFGMFLCVQDLTCPGASFLHSASIAARVPAVAAIEGNGRQYCPAANADWARRFPGMFQIQDGTVETGCLDGIGLGF